MPSVPISGKKRPLNNEEVKSSVEPKILKTCLNSATTINQQIENAILEELKFPKPATNNTLKKLYEDLELSDTDNDIWGDGLLLEKQNLNKLNENKVIEKSSECQEEVGEIINLVDDDDTCEIPVSQRKNISAQPKNLATIKKNKPPKSKEFIDDSESESEADLKGKNSKLKINEPQKRMALLIDPKHLKESSNTEGIIRCSYILIKGSRKGERCTNHQKASLCNLHKEKKENGFPKRKLNEDLDQMRKDNICMRKEILILKKQINDRSKADTNVSNEMKAICVKQEKLIEELKNELKTTNQKLIEIETIVNNFKIQNKQSTSQSTIIPAKDSKIKNTIRKKIGQLNKNFSYKLIQYDSPIKSDSRYGTFEFENGRIKIALPKQFERKDEGEGWNITWSGEEEKFKWVKAL